MKRIASLAGAAIGGFVVAGLLFGGAMLDLIATGAVAWGMQRVQRDGPVSNELASSDYPATPLMLLVVGTDDRAWIPSEVSNRYYGSFADERADLIMLVRVHGDRTATQVLSLPRDLVVEPAEFGKMTLGQAFGYGGSAVLVREVQRLTGVEVHHYVEIGFAALAQLVDRVGGVPFNACWPARDIGSGLRIDAGMQRLDGETAVSFVRARKFEVERGGWWGPEAQGDLARIERQHRIVLGLLQELRSHTSPWDLASLSRDVSPSVKVDPELSAARVIDVLRYGGFELVTAGIVPVEPIRAQADRHSPFPPAHLGSFHYLRLQQPEASAAFQALLSLPTMPIYVAGAADQDCGN